MYQPQTGQGHRQEIKTYHQWDTIKALTKSGCPAQKGCKTLKNLQKTITQSIYNVAQQGCRI